MGYTTHHITVDENVNALFAPFTPDTRSASSGIPWYVIFSVTVGQPSRSISSCCVLAAAAWSASTYTSPEETRSRSQAMRSSFTRSTTASAFAYSKAAISFAVSSPSAAIRWLRASRGSGLRWPPVFFFLVSEMGGGFVRDYVDREKKECM